MVGACTLTTTQATGADAPKGVVPVIALDDQGAPAAEEEILEHCVLELLAEQVLHDRQFGLLPVRAQGHLAPQSLGLARGRGGTNSSPSPWVEGLGRLESLLDTVVTLPVQFDSGALEIGEPCPGACEAGDRGIGYVVLLSFWATEAPMPAGPAQTVSFSARNIFARSWRTALVWIWQARLSVTPSTRPISASVRPS